MPRLIDEQHCPHCDAPLPEPKPRSCPKCMGSLQKRFLRWGCLSAAPPVIAACLAAWLVWQFAARHLI